MHRFALLLLLLPAVAIFADDKPYSPKLAPASDEAARAAKSIVIPKGMTLELWAAEPDLANPVIFAIDNKNRFFVAETFRLHKGVTDIRGIMDWLDDDLACRTVADRLAMMKRRLGKKFDEYGVHHERIRLLEDTKGAGKADKSVVFADGFNRPEEGIAAGLLVRGDTVYYTCIPDLVMLRDPKGTGKATEKKVLSTGYGIHIGFLGHDLHGLVMGPDGKIYFSIGDRGLNVKTKDRHLFYPDTGCVLRCDPDGGNLEVFATGLRNPQELAFDDHGNLFTGDNNCDSGDKARWVYVVEGGDSGWRIGYQFDGAQGSRGPWNAEKLWHPQHAGQAAWHIPPIANVADGPSGLAYYPGLGLPERYKGHFFLADFRGQPRGSLVHSFANKPSGAGFEMVDHHPFIKDVLVTDVDFGMDGSMYLSDWVSGWGLTGKGRLWKISDPKALKDPAVADAKKMLAEGFDKRTNDELAKLLSHADRRVRQEAHLALAAKDKGVATLSEVANKGKGLARLHAIWGLGIAGRKNADAIGAVRKLLKDNDAEVRGQAAKVCGEAKDKGAAEALTGLLKDEPRVRFLAAQALADIGAKGGPEVIAMLRENADKDVYLRHAGVRVLANCDEKQLGEFAKDESASVRRAVLLALRRKGSAGVANFLADADADLVTEAARAINDAPIDAATPKLAAVIERKGLTGPLGFRVLNANFRGGTAENAKALAQFAARPFESEALRVEAVKLLGMWAKPPGRDRVMGVWRPLSPRSGEPAAEAFKASLRGILSGPPKVAQEGAKVAATLGVKGIGPELLAVIEDKKQPAAVRASTLRALHALKDASVGKAVELALKDAMPRVRAEARRVLAATKPTDAITALTEALDKGDLIEKQSAFDVLGGMKGKDAEALLGKWLDALAAGKVPAEARLELVEAAEKHPPLKAKLAAYEKARPKGEPFGTWRDSLTGGDAEAGKYVFLHKQEVSCLRCHKAGGEGAGEVGPDLSGIGAQQKREYLLESIVTPNKVIAKGFETVELVLDNGRTLSGVVKAEDENEVTLLNAEGQTVKVKKDRIEQRRGGKSAMPEDLVKHLSRREMRDLVEFLASLKQAKK